jgi:HSP20 family protein
MQLVRRRTQKKDEPYFGLSQLHQELGRIFDLPSSLRSLDLLEGAWTPAVDVYETKDAVRVKAEIPGMKKEDIDLAVQGDTLILRGERKEESERKDENYYRVERTYGQFQRAITLPCPVKAEEVKAAYKDGILEVNLPKKEEAKPKQIQVEVK